MKQAEKYPDYPLETRKDRKMHCIRLEEEGPVVCYNCPYDDCHCTAACTQKEKEYNEAMYTILNDTYNRRAK